MQQRIIVAYNKFICVTYYHKLGRTIIRFITNFNTANSIFEYDARRVLGFYIVFFSSQILFEYIHTSLTEVLCFPNGRTYYEYLSDENTKVH